MEGTGNAKKYICEAKPRNEQVEEGTEIFIGLSSGSFWKGVKGCVNDILEEILDSRFWDMVRTWNRWTEF